MKRQTVTDRPMPATFKSEADRARAQYAALAKHYRPIGPASVAAALMHMPKTTKPALKAN